MQLSPEPNDIPHPKLGSQLLLYKGRPVLSTSQGTLGHHSLCIGLVAHGTRAGIGGMVVSIAALQVHTSCSSDLQEDPKGHGEDLCLYQGISSQGPDLDCERVSVTSLENTSDLNTHMAAFIHG